MAAPVLPDGGAVAAKILGRFEKASGPEEPDADDSPDAGLDAAASDLIDAIKAGDPGGVKDALRAAMEMLKSEPDGDES